MKGQFKETKASNPKFRESYDKVKWVKEENVKYNPKYLGVWDGMEIKIK